MYHRGGDSIIPNARSTPHRLLAPAAAAAASASSRAAGAGRQGHAFIPVSPPRSTTTPPPSTTRWGGCTDVRRPNRIARNAVDTWTNGTAGKTRQKNNRATRLGVQSGPNGARAYVYFGFPAPRGATLLRPRPSSASTPTGHGAAHPSPSP